MRVLVTGGAGFIGSHTVDLLVRSGHRVVVLDDLITGHAEAVHPGAKLIRGDCGDSTILRTLLSEYNIEAILHLAASIEAGESLRFPERFFANNTGRSFILLEAAINFGIRRFVFASTAAVYGDPGPEPVRENHPLDPLSPYGHSKMMVEQALAWMHRQRGLGCAILRCFNAAGCATSLGEDHQPETHLIPLALDYALGHRDGLDLFGTDHPTPDGTCVRDYVHVLDLAEAFRLALTHVEPESWGVWNLGSGQGHSVKEVLDAARKTTGHPLHVRETQARPGDPSSVVADTTRVRHDLGWKPLHSNLESLVESAWAWRHRHPQGYQTPGAAPSWTSCEST
jgi:UDP-glucose 4-epimerase